RKGFDIRFSGFTGRVWLIRRCRVDYHWGIPIREDLGQSQVIGEISLLGINSGSASSRFAKGPPGIRS
ncbi:MAG: hypothetical protein AAF191_14845, partial [Verrucomicrobiota bacterium]